MKDEVSQSDGRHYEYTPRWSFFLVFSGLFAVSTVGFAALACAKRPIARCGVRLFSPEEAAVVFWCCAAVCLAMMLYLALLAIFRLVRSQRLVFTPTAIIVPKSRWSSAEITIPYSTITSLSCSGTSGQRLLKIVHERGKITISSWFLRTDKQFDEVHYLLSELTGRSTE